MQYVWRNNYLQMQCQLQVNPVRLSALLFRVSQVKGSILGRQGGGNHAFAPLIV
jgi:hypothetical protein